MGAYTYPATGSAHPHAVSSAGGTSYVYDANGNMTSAGGLISTYDTESRPTSLSRLIGTESHSYDAYFTQSPNDATRQAFIATLTHTLTEYDTVDLFLLAHSNRYIDWVATIDPALRTKIRLVYNTGCYDATQAQAWLQLGAHTAVAHPGLSDSPVFYFFFLRRWTLGESLDQVVVASNERMRTVLELASAATQQRLNSKEHYANSQALCFGDCSITIGG